MDFTAFDVEVANPNLSSICQVGVVQFRDGIVSRRWKSFVNPDDYFDPVNVSIHGISESDVVGAPTFPEMAAQLNAILTSGVVCHHTAFDRTAIKAVHGRYSLPMPEIQWLDSARVVRRTWLDRSRSGYCLRSVADMLGIEFNHHDAEEDARAAGEVLVHAIRQSGRPLSEWLVHVQRPITPSATVRHTRDGNPDGPLYGETAVFTGALSMPRRKAADLAASAGCDVGSSVNKSTTLLIVGDQDVSRLSGHAKSSKHRKAEANIAKGQTIRILRESDFITLLESS